MYSAFSDSGWPSQDFGNVVARLVHRQFDRGLPRRRKGKPEDGKEWTVLSGIVEEVGRRRKLSVVALGTGTGCLGENETSLAGDLVHDSHAEAICRRAFVHYLLQQMKKRRCDDDDDSIFLLVPSLTSSRGTTKRFRDFKLKPDVRFHFYSSHPPCGDAADVDTGAKLVSGSDTVRTKPGRGDPTASLSCSDKMAKWNLVGLQGCLLACVLDSPIVWASVTVGSDNFNKANLVRALFRRFPPSPEVTVHDAKREKFRWGKSEGKFPCSSSIAFNTSGLFDVLADGRKQGVVKKHFGTSKARSKICRLEIAKQFVSVLQANDQISFLLEAKLSYCELKRMCKDSCIWRYQDRVKSFEDQLPEQRKTVRRRKMDGFVIDVVAPKH